MWESVISTTFLVLTIYPWLIIKLYCHEIGLISGDKKMTLQGKVSVMRLWYYMKFLRKQNTYMYIYTVPIKSGHRWKISKNMKHVLLNFDFIEISSSICFPSFAMQILMRLTFSWACRPSYVARLHGKTVCWFNLWWLNVWWHVGLLFNKAVYTFFIGYLTMAINFQWKSMKKVNDVMLAKE